ncbi:MAG: UPF0236 family protein [Cyanobacteriota bacterium]|nr:UPF0236 family protein [Cyanobacteriota bacterium]
MLLGCEHVFGQVPALAKSLLGVEVNQSQVYRTCQRAAFVADESVLDEPSVELGEQLCSQQQTVYGMVDGSMLLTDQGWQEVKVGRVFEAHLAVEGQASINHAQQTDLKQIKWDLSTSQYVANRGNHEEFTQKFEQLFPPDALCEKVFISDGAIWMSKWLLEKYPHATHILDYYHLKQKLATAAQAAPDSRQWLQQQEENLFAGQQLAVEQAVQALEHLHQPGKNQLLEYLQNNRYRTRYDLYRKQGLMISSGPIEAAHRTLLQVRMKRSGQRWSERGSDRMILLRAAYKSEKFHLITDLFRQENYRLAA